MWEVNGKVCIEGYSELYNANELAPQQVTTQFFCIRIFGLIGTFSIYRSAIFGE
jgi:hypothetical protein